MTSSCRNVERISQSTFKEIHGYISCPHNSRFIVRDFVYSEELLVKQREDMAMADVTEKELWVNEPSYTPAYH